MREIFYQLVNKERGFGEVNVYMKRNKKGVCSEDVYIWVSVGKDKSGDEKMKIEEKKYEGEWCETCCSPICDNVWGLCKNKEIDNEQKHLEVMEYINNLAKLAVHSKTAYYRLLNIKVAGSVEFKISDSKRKWQE